MQSIAPPMPRYNNLLDMFVSQAAQHGDKPLLWAVGDNGIYENLSWRNVAVKASLLTKSLRAIGVKPGDRVVLVSENRPEWLISDLAIMAAGAITVPAYCTNTADDHRHVIEHSEASCVIVSTKALAEVVSPVAASAKLCKLLISMEDLRVGPSGYLDYHSWAGLVETDASSKGVLEDGLEQASRTISRDDTACFIYTSGTGGRPKAVMQSHGNLLANLAGAWQLMAPLGLKDEVFLSFLPLSHSFEHTLGQFFPIAIGGQIYFGQGVEQLAANIEQSRPTMMACVPRLFEAMSQRITRTVERHGGLKAKLFHLTQRLGRKKFSEHLGPLDFLLDALMEKIVRRKFRARFGGRLKVMVSAGAALDPDIALFFIAMGVPVLQGYGQTEAGPMISGNSITKNKPATIGPPIEGVEVRIAEDGEILVRGDNVMQGYWKDTENTASTVWDGWLHTGDIGTLDNDGYLILTDRKKDIIVLAGGDNVSPARLEGLLVQQDDIAQAMVFGDEFSALSALIVPEDGLLKRTKVSHVDIQGKDDPALRRALSSAVDHVNGQVQAIEKIRQFFVITEPFTIENTQLTPTLKIRRHAIKSIYADLF